MKNTSSENISEHSLDVAMISHILVLIKNKIFGANLNAERAALIGMYHDAPEILTGDMPTPVKYFNNEIRSAYKQVEEISALRLISMLPDEFREEYKPLLIPLDEDEELWTIVKAADKLSALIKCIEEKKAGNREFLNAELSAREALEKMNLPEADYFMKNFLPSYSLTLDEQECNI